MTWVVWRLEALANSGRRSQRAALPVWSIWACGVFTPCWDHFSNLWKCARSIQSCLCVPCSTFAARSQTWTFTALWPSGQQTINSSWLPRGRAVSFLRLCGPTVRGRTFESWGQQKSFALRKQSFAICVVLILSNASCKACVFPAPYDAWLFFAWLIKVC